ncbi:MAG TPA: prephenate dehydrogenase [Aggregatilineales bacterium]|nr:prephenate dehydrogenase [Aggregatilineales bacterium]
MPDSPDACVIGLGLIGGSIAAALTQSQQYHTVTGWDIKAAAVQTALEQGYINQSAATLEEAVANADLIILAVYIRAIIECLHTIAPIVKDNALILDTGSTKEKVVEAMNRLPERVCAVGGHPMAGQKTAHVSGIDASMFRDSVFVLTPTERSNGDAMQRAQTVVSHLHAYPFTLDAVQHDHYVAIISHLVRVVPIAMAATATAADTGIAWKLAAGGFRESTREASEELTFWKDVFATNTSGLPKALREFSRQIEKFAELVETGDLESIIEASEQAKKAWLDRYGADS